ncbi:MAG: Rpn family recombination-promoting nuclease/putative transposase [Microcoleus sp. PH2017_29_MFU_D_A]|uniref:Rpn family recombination-promoting nuclease/putative transposase n=1 Tax=unclassified Microcoleus TaxID=2642155 RepID=UPI001D4D6BCE|nr:MULTISPECIES: Rpn family recombination-promoting nuclease/putative transposase [unclassified Microcoleus]MCC3432212.1 Rpn family recombination-promoting nuclease/putative transposase [Microcoleus sp. PH2017_04_SCI_O_A]MCC3445564.1 Rpn family recombination-promoting nuclease/putative transposase [Microcoleus sp. PH2017_03_ELD_O_A]MCC3502033.1 Rpn family recombination-promoting nuclease/putative transposase [Microcoleus sp. PH2017_19_SFW_U_A]TAF88053.1 MAG: Rpn family recombination-promoting n
MRFINPKIDFAFKRIFGSNQNTDILISFLNALLYDGEAIVESLEIIDPSLVPPIVGLKNSYLDVKARLNDGTFVIIEMQVLNVQAFSKRVLYNAAKTYALQLTMGELYRQLRPVIALTITDFKMFDDSQDVISHFIFKERTRLSDYPDNQMELVFVELPKFQKELEELKTIADKWIYFIKTTGSLNEVPQAMATVPQIQRAFEIANQVSLTREEFDMLQEQEFLIQDQEGSVALSREEGREEGKKQGQIELTMRLLNRRLGQLNPDVQTQIGELSIDKLDDLTEALLDFSNAEDLTAWLEVNSQ